MSDPFLTSAPTSSLAEADLPLRNSEEIQGNILAGFNKDHQILLFLRFIDPVQARAWLKAITPMVAKTRDVAAFNTQFSQARKLNGGVDPQDLKATWVSLSLTHSGIVILAPEFEQDMENFSSFRNGPEASAVFLNDTGKSDPFGWEIGGKSRVDAIVTIAADEEADMLALTDQLKALASQHDLALILEQRGDTLPGASQGHEHFGFKDGISQPGVHGFDRPDSAVPGDVAGHKGSHLIAPGEFLLGHAGEGFAGSTVPSAPHPFAWWMRDGSFQVFRKLEQDVPGFWAQVISRAEALPASDGISAELLAAKLVGRWRSGTPLDLAPTTDDGETRNPADDNNFSFQGDTQGARCPHFAHIRKVYPRNNAAFSDEQHRIMRRGIPYGEPFNPTAGSKQGVDAARGLLFIAYMASIENQFEFLQSTWANNSFFPNTGNGPDPIIGDTARPAPNTLNEASGVSRSLEFNRFVHTRGAVYAFAPSLSTLRRLAEGGQGVPNVEAINSHAVGFAFLRLYKLHPDIGLPLAEQQGDVGGSQQFENARLVWTGEKVRVEWNDAVAPRPFWMEGQNPKEFEV